MNKDKLKEVMTEIFREELSLQVEHHMDYEGIGFEVSVEFMGEKITSDYFITKRNDY